MGTARINSTRFQKNLENFESISCDTMIFSYQIYNHPIYSQLTSNLFTRMEEEKIRIYSSILSYFETLSSPEINESNNHIINGFFLQTPLLNLIPIDLVISERAAYLRRTTNLKAIDSIQLATALEAKTPVFLTNDKDILKVKNSGIRIAYLSEYIKD